LKARHIIQSPEANWLNQQYGTWTGITKQGITALYDDEDDEPFINPSLDKSRDTEAGREPETMGNGIEILDTDNNPIKPNLTRALQKLSSFLSPKAQTISQEVCFNPL
jgi:hypothetical protein